MSTTVARPADAELLERVLLTGDLSKLSPGQRVEYYRRVCESVGLNWMTRPFEYLVLNNRLILYARRDATDQLRRIHKVSIAIQSRIEEGLFICTAKATVPEGRTDESIGVVAIAGLRGEVLANSLMKAETKSKRRVTLSICGLGWLDETEVDSIPEARQAQVDPETGEVKTPPATVTHTTGEAPQVERVASTEQQRQLWGQWRRHKLGEEQMKVFLRSAYQLDKTSMLSDTQIGDLIEHLKEVETVRIQDYLRTLAAEAGPDLPSPPVAAPAPQAPATREDDNGTGDEPA